jgi:hypothetical protein
MTARRLVGADLDVHPRLAVRVANDAAHELTPELDRADLEVLATPRLDLALDDARALVSRSNPKPRPRKLVAREDEIEAAIRSDPVRIDMYVLDSRVSGLCIPTGDGPTIERRAAVDARPRGIDPHLAPIEPRVRRACRR